MENRWTTYFINSYEDTLLGFAFAEEQKVSKKATHRILAYCIQEHLFYLLAIPSQTVDHCSSYSDIIHIDKNILLRNVKP